MTAISPGGLQHKCEKAWGKDRAARHGLGGPKAAAPDALLRTPLGPILFSGPVVARPWRLDPDDFAEVLRLFANSPGFHATLPHTFEGQPKGHVKGLRHTPMSDEPELLAELVTSWSSAPRAEAPA